MSGAGRRLAFVDLLKAVAAQLVVLHHLAFYGPLSDSAAALLPGLIEWLSQQARIAVQVFLVVGGFLAARSLAPEGCWVPDRQLLPVVWQRYRRLAGPYVVALLVAIMGSALASRWMVHDSISAPPGPGQFLAHVLLLHDLLGYEALSAGVWYVAIDFQLYCLLALLLWLGGQRRLAGLDLGVGLVVLLLLASLFHFNLDRGWDVWALYFFGSYGLGALAWWSARPGGCHRLGGLILLLASVALAMEFRDRIAVATFTAASIALIQSGNLMPDWQARPLAAFLSRISYGVFLIHFPVCLVVNAAFTRFVPLTPELALLGMGLAWGMSILAGAVFHYWVEQGVTGKAWWRLRPAG
ncbi:acyltransferase [Azovibrio restrictus]|uniref:acyltransferase family protein n=1 Tax=Azovibrio restrictus TaxID=146938 RepID=UPI0026F2191D|nr:acyltransferase family protein [Azovibrio restrictus]